ncbi:MAG: ABC transporter permease [Chlorobi bacterium]|nr:ABC transporter permease [Chlorobiota bacterium]
MNYLKIAWRNLWRNKRRTLITAASVFFGVIFAAVMSSMQEGSYGTMIDNVVKFYSGYLQIHNVDYWENKTINNTFTLNDSLLKKVSSVNEVTSFSPRLESYALASSEDLTKGAMVIGIDPVGENKITNPEKWIIRGRYLEPGSKGIIMGKELAGFLQIDVGDTLVLLGMGYHGANAAGKYPVEGIFEYPLPEFNKQFIYMDLKLAQDFYSADNLVTSLVIMVKNHYHLPHAKKKLNMLVSSPYSLMSWDEMQPEIVQMIDADRSGGKIMKAILYLIIAFGILGTIMMMISERRREMGVMVAIGMQKSVLGIILFFETLYIGFLGVISGIAGSVPIIAYYYNHPIRLTGEAAKTYLDMGLEPVLAFSWQPFVFYNQAITVFVLTLLIAIYPLYKSFHLNVTTSLRA